MSLPLFDVDEQSLLLVPGGSPFLMVERCLLSGGRFLPLPLNLFLSVRAFYGSTLWSCTSHLFQCSSKPFSSSLMKGTFSVAFVVPPPAVSLSRAAPPIHPEVPIPVSPPRSKFRPLPSVSRQVFLISLLLSMGVASPSHDFFFPFHFFAPSS